MTHAVTPEPQYVTSSGASAQRRRAADPRRARCERRGSGRRRGRAAPRRRASAASLRASRSTSDGSSSRARISSAVIVSSSRGRASKSPRTGAAGASPSAGRRSCARSNVPARSWPRWRSSHQHRAAQPEPSSSARTSRDGPTPTRAEGLLELLDVRQRVASSDGGVGPDRREVEPPGRGGRRRGCGPRRTRPAAARRSARSSRRAPRGATSSSSTRWSGKSALIAATQPSAIGDPRDHRRARARERRARGTRAAGLARTTSSTSEGRYGSWSQSSSAAANSVASPLAAPAPSRAARPALAAASACGTVAGSAPRDALVDVRELGMMAIAASGSVSAIRAIFPSQARVRPPRSAAPRLSACGSSVSPAASSSSGLASGAAATSPSAIAAADEPSPRSSGIAFRTGSCLPAGSARSAYARTARLSCVGESSAAPSPSTTTPASVRHLELVPEIERDGGGVEAGADVRGGRGCADDHRAGPRRRSRRDPRRPGRAVARSGRRSRCPSARGR